MCAACISSINQHCFEGERGVLIKESKKYCKCSKTLAEIVGQSQWELIKADSKVVLSPANIVAEAANSVGNVVSKG